MFVTLMSLGFHAQPNPPPRRSVRFRDIGGLEQGDRYVGALHSWGPRFLIVPGYTWTDECHDSATTIPCV